MTHVMEKMIDAIARFKPDRSGLHLVINALDDLRRHSDLPGDTLDDFYIDLEEINGVAIYQDRSVNDQEVEKINRILQQLSVMLSGK